MTQMQQADFAAAAAGAEAPPAATMIILTYNHARFVRRALQAAFDQTYPNLEIIVSDDGGDDDTVAIVREMAAAYRGPHRLRVNVNPVNLGLTAHIDHLMTLATGDLIVAAAGDDVSAPNRVERLVEVWRREGVHALYSAVRRIDEEDRLLPPPPDDLLARPDASPERFVRERLTVTGAAQAWSRSLYDTFGPLAPVALIEDAPVAFRALLLGGIGYVDEALVDYRDGGMSADTGGALRYADNPYRLKRLRWRLSTLRIHARDAALIEGVDHGGLLRIIGEEIEIIDFDLRMARDWNAARLRLLREALGLTIMRRRLAFARCFARYVKRALLARMGR